MSEYKLWERDRSFVLGLLDNLMAQPKLGRYSVLEEEEEEEEELVEDAFFDMAALFEEGDSKAIRRNLDRMISASYSMANEYIPAFRESGLHTVFTNLVSMDGVSPEVQVRILLIITNLTSRVETPEYGEVLVQEGIIHQLVYHVTHLTNHETVFWAIRCLTNLACISLAIRDQVLEAFTPDEILHLGQSRVLDPGSHDEFLNMLRAIVCDLDEEHIEPVLAVVSAFFMDYLGKKTIMLKLAALLSRYRQFDTYFADILPELRKLFMRATKCRHQELLLTVFIECLKDEREPEQYFPIVEKIHNAVRDVDEAFLPAYSSFICEVMRVAPDILTHEQTVLLLDGFLERREGVRQVTKKHVARAVLWLTHTVKEGLDLELFIDYLSFDDLQIHRMVASVLGECFEACESRGDYSYQQELFELDAISEIMTLRDETDDQELFDALQHILDMVGDPV